jgi:predicted DNA binding CopG/RHH family protein
MSYLLRLDKGIAELFEKPVSTDIKKRLENLKPEVVSLVQKPKEILLNLSDEKMTELKNLATRENMSVNRFINTYLFYDMLAVDTDRMYWNENQSE